ncbi:MAG: glycosyltransferase [Patescibacteria group bacterium]|nr:glycosyltransferase [Patescibacteria group bacterium]
MKKRVSVIIPTYNFSQYIGEAIDSVLNQTYKNIEIIVIDDGSTDNIHVVLGKYIKNGQIKYFYQENRGPGVARNLGIKNSFGDFIAFLDADDVWRSDKLEKQMKLFENPKVGLVYSDMEFFGNNFHFKKYSEMTKRFYQGEAMMELIKRNFIPVSSVILRRGVFDRTDYFTEDFKNLAIIEDYELWLRVAKIFEIDFIPDALVRYRIHGAQMSHGRARNYRSLAFLYKKLLKDSSFPRSCFIIYVRYLENKLKFFIASLFNL